MTIPKISPSELAAIAYGKATETVDTATAQIAAKTAEIEALASAGAAASKISVLSNSISTLSGGLAAAEALQELQLKKINFALLDDIEMTHWASPILPIVKNTLGLTLSDYVYIFYPGTCGDKKLFMNINDYYYIRLSPSNFKNY